MLKKKDKWRKQPVGWPRPSAAAMTAHAVTRPHGATGGADAHHAHEGARRWRAEQVQHALVGHPAEAHGARRPARARTTCSSTRARPPATARRSTTSTAACACACVCAPCACACCGPPPHARRERARARSSPGRPSPCAAERPSSGARRRLQAHHEPERLRERARQDHDAVGDRLPRDAAAEAGGNQDW